MIACAKWLGRTSQACTRKPDGCMCAGQEAIQALIAHRAPLPPEAEIFNSAGQWQQIHPAALESANRVPNTMSDSEPFWLHGWTDLWPRLRVIDSARSAE